jgi:acyl-CoA thioester hydrolase
MRMRWGDMDALGHMNNTVYFRYFEQARIAWFDAIGADYKKLPEGPILGSIACRFVLPAVYPCDLEVTLVAGAPRRSAFPPTANCATPMHRRGSTRAARR